MALPSTDRHHHFHAEARALHGSLVLPLRHLITPQASAHLEEAGGYISQKTGEFRVGTAVSYRAASTQVAGNPGAKPGHGWNTLATATVEGLNIVNVLTADRIVAQIATEHPLIGYTPKISFLGTQFENLRIAGHPVNLKLDTGICGPGPAGDKPYHEDPEFMERVRKQCSDLCSYPDLPAEALAKYQKYTHGTAPVAEAGAPTEVECSLVHEATGEFPGRSFGQVIHVPNFGTIYLATVSIHHEVKSDYPGEDPTPRTTVGLTMVHAKLGCLIEGEVTAAPLTTNGPTRP